MFNSPFNLSDLDGTNGFVINGDGFSVSGAGDINGDGIDDLIIPSYVVFGSTEGFPASLDLSTLDGSNGFDLNNELANLSSFSDAGDINGDGIDDLIIGAPVVRYYNGSYPGQSYVVFGSTEGFPASLDLSTLDGSNGFALNGEELSFSGSSVSGAGDINGDGIDDLIIGAPGAKNSYSAGQSYVVFGSTEGFPASLDLSALDGSNGFALNGIDSSDYSGNSVSGVGDINGDGIDDLIIGATVGEVYPIINGGQSYVVFGSTEGFPASLDLSDLNGSNGFALNGEEWSFSGRSVSGAGDINGDGIDDLIIGAPGRYDPTIRRGRSYVVFGSTQGFPASFDLSDLDGSNGFILNGIDADERSGTSVSGAGDINGDGIDDVIIGAPGNRGEVGQSYVVFGSREGFPASFDLSTLDGTNGFILNGIDVYDLSGSSVSGAGDINGDGIDDVIIAAPFAGQSYVVFGQASNVGPEGDDTVFGTVGDDTLYGGAGNDTLFGSEGVNSLFGEDGDDLIYGGSQTDSISGGQGSDQIFAAEGNNTINGGAGDDVIYSGAGNDRIDAGSGNDTIWLGGGHDTIVLSLGNGVDTINNFQLGQTQIGLSGGLTFDQLSITQQMGATHIEVTSSSEDLARLVGVQANSIDSSSFVIV